MSMSKEETPFERVLHAFDPQSTLLRVWTLPGGVSAQITALEIERVDGHTHKLIVRQHGKRDLKRNSQIAADEFKLLHLLHAAGIATPIPYHLDQTGTILSTPYIVMEYIEGETDFAPAQFPHFLRQFALHLSRIHQIDASKLDVSFLPTLEKRDADLVKERPTTVNDAYDEGRIRKALQAVWPLPQRNTSVVLHGDFWPGNVLWKEGQLVAIIDWEDAMLGDPLADVANSRLEILWAFGVDAMQHFTQQYRSIMPIDCTHLPYWDLWAALRPVAHIGQWGLDATTEKTMRTRHHWFVSHLLVHALH